MALDDHHKHFVGTVAQKALIEHEGKILLVQYPEGDAVAEMWDMPGGRLHEGESPLEGLKREVREEINAEIEVKEILATGVNVINENKKMFFVIYRASLINPTQGLTPEEGEIGNIEWHDKKDFFALPIIFKSYQEALKPFLV